MLNSSTNSDKQNVLAIWIGQLSLFSLKCDLHDLLLLRHDFIDRMAELGISRNPAIQKEALLSGTSTFCAIVKQRFSLREEAAELFEQKLKSFISAFLDGKDMENPISELRVTDAWCGLSSSLSNFPMPLSLLDYILDIVLPVVAAEQVKAVCLPIDKMFTDSSPDSHLLENIDDILGQITCRLCFNANLDTTPCNELKLAILMHLPHGNKDFSMKTGYVFKLLQMKYSHTEVK